MQAITTKYLGPTNHRPSRIKAECDAGSLTLGYHMLDHSPLIRGDDAHQRAAYALLLQLGWADQWDLASGTLKRGGEVHVLVPKRYVSTELDDKYRAAAWDKYHRDGELEIDDNAKVSKGEDPGAYVQAWVWVYDNEAGLTTEEEDDNA